MKYVFVITTALGLLQARLITKKQNISLDDVVILTIANLNETYYNLYFKDSGVQRVNLTEHWSCLSQYYGPNPTIIPKEYYYHAKGLIDKIEQVTKGSDLSVFVPNVDGAQFVIVANYLKCKHLSIFEEGSSAYVVTDLDETDTKEAFAKYLEQNPELAYENSGICTYEPRKNHDIELLVNPNIGTEQSPIVFYRFSDLSYTEKLNSPKVVQFINYNLAEIIDINDHSAFVPAFVQAYKFYLATKSQTDSVDNFVLPVWAVDALFPLIVGFEEYKRICTSLLNSIKQLWSGKCNFVAVKLHPNIIKDTERYQVIIKLLEDAGFHYEILSNEFSIDQELSLFPAHTISMFSVCSSLLLYSLIANQNSYTGHELIIDGNFWIGWLLFHGFNMKKLLGQINQNKQQKAMLINDLIAKLDSTQTFNFSVEIKGQKYKIKHLLSLFLNQDISQVQVQLDTLTASEIKTELVSLINNAQHYYQQQYAFIENLRTFSQLSKDKFSLNCLSVPTNINGYVKPLDLTKSLNNMPSSLDVGNHLDLVAEDLNKFVDYLELAFKRQFNSQLNTPAEVFYLDSEQSVINFYQVVNYKKLDPRQILVIVNNQEVLDQHATLKLLPYVNVSSYLEQLQNYNPRSNYFDYISIIKNLQVFILGLVNFKNFNLYVESLDTEVVFALGTCNYLTQISVLANASNLGENKDFGQSIMVERYLSFYNTFQYLMSSLDLLNQDNIITDIYSVKAVTLNADLKIKGRHINFV